MSDRDEAVAKAVDEAKVRNAMRLLAASMSETEDEKPATWLKTISLFAALAAILPIVYVRGWAMVKLWTWFAAPIWPSVHLTIYSAVGLFFIASIFHHHKLDDEGDGKADVGKLWKGLIYGVTFPLVTVGCGWLWMWLQWGL